MLCSSSPIILDPNVLRISCSLDPGRAETSFQLGKVLLPICAVTLSRIKIEDEQPHGRLLRKAKLRT